MKQSRASHSSSPSCIWGTGKPTGALAMITASTNNLYGHRVDNTRKWREQFVQLPQFVLKHKLTVLWTKPPDFRRVFVYFWHHVNRLGKLPSKEQQLSRTQHFILKAHAAIFVLHIQYGPRGTPLTPTELSLINIIMVFHRQPHSTEVGNVAPMGVTISSSPWFTGNHGGLDVGRFCQKNLFPQVPIHRLNPCVKLKGISGRYSII